MGISGRYGTGIEAVKCDPVLHVAVGVLRDGRGRVLIARRPAHAHQGGLWEFPGGKIQPGEDIQAGLRRELREELDIELRAARPLIRIPYAYTDRTVLLDVWKSRDFAGTPWGREGQAVKWVAAEDLQVEDFPAANRPIIHAVRLPSVYAISDEPRAGVDAFLYQLEQVLAAGVRLVQFRAKTLDEAVYRAAAGRAATLCRAYQAWLLLNAPPQWVAPAGAAGVHLTTRRLMELTRRPLDAGLWVAASCHTGEEVAHACAIGVDFIVAGPVLTTASHPGAPTLGWEGLQVLTEAATVPVYALGGVSVGDRDMAFRHGAQGIAAISSLWNTHARVIDPD